MSDLGDDFAAMKAERQQQRQGSYDAGVRQIVEATTAAREAKLDLIVSNDGHHWRFLKNERTLFSFWPAGARGLSHVKSGAKSFRVRGWKHALSEAKRIADELARS